MKHTLGKKLVKHRDSQIEDVPENNLPEIESEISSEAALVVSMSALREKSLKQSIIFTAFYLHRQTLFSFLTAIRYEELKSFNSTAAGMVRKDCNVPKLN